MTIRRLILGTRGSALARWQADHVSERLQREHSGVEIEQLIIKTEGDSHSKILGASSARGVFVREIEDALAEGRIDLAVHSLKDLPTEQPEALAIAAVPERHDPRDVLLTLDGCDLSELPAGSKVATGSFRRRCQILAERPDLVVVPVRGNVDTRIRKLKEGMFDALVLALAGVERLGLSEVPFSIIPTERCLPAVGQGALGIEIRKDDEAARNCIKVLNHEQTRRAVDAERAFLHRLGGGCLAPATAYAEVRGDSLVMRAVVGSPDGKRMLHDREEGDSSRPVETGETLADRMVQAGAAEILEEARRGAADE